MTHEAGWSGAARRLRQALRNGLKSFTLYSGVPWADLPNQGWTVEADGAPAPLPMPMDGGPSTPPDRRSLHGGARPLTAAEHRAWRQIRGRLGDLEGTW